MVSTKGDTRAQRLPKDTCRFGTDLKFADLASVKSTKWLNDFVASVNGQLVVNTDRYIFQMAALETMLSKGALVSNVGCPMNSSQCLPARLVWLQSNLLVCSDAQRSTFMLGPWPSQVHSVWI